MKQTDKMFKCVIIGLLLFNICQGFENLGCYYDYSESRTLPGLDSCNLPEPEDMCNDCSMAHPYCENLESMTVDFCHDLCHRRGFLYSGLEAGSQCFCGDNFDPVNPANGQPPNDQNCTEPCTGDSSQVCGGELRIIMYKNDAFMNCSTPIDFSNGTVTPSQDVFASGTTVTLTCNDGFYQVGPTESYCWYSGVFSHITKDVQPQCIRECTELTSSVYKEVNRNIKYPGVFVVGDNITYTCSEGYEPRDPAVTSGDLECREDRLWAENLPICDAVSCGDPGTPDQGTLIGEKFVYPHSVSYQCNAGYNLIGGSTRQCQSDKSWTGTLPSCIPVDCGTLNNITNGMVSYVGTTFSMVASYTCETGYNLIGDNTRTCQASTLWSGVAPNCQLVDCGDPGLVVNGNSIGSVFTYGSIVQFSCNPGYQQFGALTITCQSDGQWSDPVPVCQPVDCGAVSAGQGVFTGGMTFTYGSVLNFFCDAGYNVVSGDTSITCQADGTWSGDVLVCELVDCGDPGTLTDGSRTGDGNTYGSTISYTCNTGYDIMGAQSIMCQENGTWSDSAPTCQIVNCGDPGTPMNGVKTGNDETYGSNVDYTCNNGYDIIGAQRITCQADGTWSDSAPTCQIVDCMHPGSPAGLIVEVTNTTYTAIVRYSCSMSGYSISTGNDWRMCGADGQWSGNEPTCSIGSCGEPSTPEFSIRSGENYEVSAVVNYQCMMGYEHSGGNVMITCQTNGTWSGEPIVCTAVDCGDPGTLTDGSRTGDLTTYGSTVSYTCNAGYDIMGAQNITCQADGTWSDSAPTCQKMPTTAVTGTKMPTTAVTGTTLNPTTQGLTTTTTIQSTTQRPSTMGTKIPTTQETTQRPTTELLTTRQPAATQHTQRPATSERTTTKTQRPTKKIILPTKLITNNSQSPELTSNKMETTQPTNTKSENAAAQTTDVTDYMMYIIAGIAALLIIILILGVTYILSARKKKKHPLTESTSIEAIPNPAYVDGFAESPVANTNEGFDMKEENEVEPGSPTSNGSAVDTGNDVTDGWNPVGHLESETSGGKFKPKFMSK